MNIRGTEGMTVEELNREVGRGGRFVIFQYCISMIVLTFKRSSNIYFIKPGKSTLVKSIRYTLISLALGWWGIPWGPAYTVTTVFTNFRGGKNITLEVISSLNET